MSLDSQQVARVAALARLKLPADQIPQVQQQLNDILALMEQLTDQNTEGVEPLAHPLSLVQNIALRLRQDAVTETDNRHNNMANAPVAQKGLFLVPKVIE